MPALSAGSCFSRTKMTRLISRKEYTLTRKPPVPVFLAKFLGWLLPFSFPNALRPLLLRAAGAHVGEKVYIGKLCVFDDNFPELLTIEDHAIISSGCLIFAHDVSTEEATVGKITIKRGAYIGMGAMILPGVTIGENAIVGAGAVVTKDVEPNTIVVGVPACPIKRSSEPRLARGR